jgi:NAD(P)-dependent dehydrogenase (short-subunit alcohol dehydrogenase family)
MPKIAWLTGASTGIGRAVALRLAADGWRVAASARNAEALATLAAEAPPGSIAPYPLDVTDRDACMAGAERIERELGPLDLVIFSAGAHRPMPATEFSSATLRALIDINLMGVAHGLEAVLPHLIARRSGRVMIVASLAGYRGLPTAAAYGASKAALINMAEGLRPELAAEGVILQVVNPGFVKTPMTDQNRFPMPFLVTAEEAAAAIVRGMRGDRFEIAFPTPFAWFMKLVRIIPDRIYFYLTRRISAS